MAMYSFDEFRNAMSPALTRLGMEKKNMSDLALEIKEQPRTLTAAEFLLLLANECRRTHSRRERNYE